MKRLIKLIFCHILYRVKYHNKEILKKIEKCVICPNHSNIFDPTFIYPVVDNLSIMAKSEIFKNKIIAEILKHYQVFPVNRNKTDVNSLMQALKMLEKDNCKLLIFPEGKVIKTENEIGLVKKGAVFIAATLQIPILPVYITRRPRFFSKIDVIFGEPMIIGKDILKDKRKIIEKSKKLVEEIYKLNQ